MSEPLRSEADETREMLDILDAIVNGPDIILYKDVRAGVNTMLFINTDYLVRYGA